MQTDISGICPKCGAKNYTSYCSQCGFEVGHDLVLSVDGVPDLPFRKSSYANWIKNKNITIWVKDV